MKNRKGFTLAELLAIIVILGVIMIIAAPNITKQITKKEKMDVSILNQKIENAAKLYVAKYYAKKVVDGALSDGPVTFTLSDLQNDGLINLSKNGSCDGILNENIKVSSQAEKIEYIYVIDSKNKLCYDCTKKDNYIICSDDNVSE